MGITNKISVALITIILFIGFIGDMGVWGAILTTILIPMFVHGGFILKNGLNTYKVNELGIHPHDLGYEYEGQGKYIHSKTQEWFEFYYGQPNNHLKGESANIKSWFIIYGLILVFSATVMYFNSSGTEITKDYLYEQSVKILEKEYEKTLDSDIKVADYGRMTVEVSQIGDNAFRLTSIIIFEDGFRLKYYVDMYFNNRNKLIDSGWRVGL